MKSTAMLNRVVEEYLKLYPKDKGRLKLLLDQINAGEDLRSRHNFTGHVTGSALIFSPDRKEVLLIYHPTFERWQQPGGHWDENEIGPWLATKREVFEETGVKIEKQLGHERIPILIESHLVPTKSPKNEPEHYHHAFWYVYRAASKDLQLRDDVIKEAKWVSLNKIERPVIKRAIQRAKNL